VARTTENAVLAPSSLVVALLGALTMMAGLPASTDPELELELDELELDELELDVLPELDDALELELDVPPVLLELDEFASSPQATSAPTHEAKTPPTSKYRFIVHSSRSRCGAAACRSGTTVEREARAHR